VRQGVHLAEPFLLFLTTQEAVDDSCHHEISGDVASHDLTHYSRSAPELRR
jgi:hypothetical protein